MTPRTTMGAGAAAHAAMIANATKASGVIVRVTPADFLSILERATAPLVVVAQGGIFVKYHKYLTSYKGIAFFTKSAQPFLLPRGTETVVANKIWIPG